MALLGALVPASASYGDNAAYTFAPPQGYVSGLPGSQWTYNPAADTATAGMPGNLPGQVTAKLANASYSKLVVAPDSGVMAPPVFGGVQVPLSVKSDASTSPLDPAVSACLGTNMTPGYVNQCTSYTTTITFPRPVWNPVISHMSTLGYGWRVVGSGTNVAYRCWLSWNEARVASVNGSAPVTNQVSLLTTNGAANITPDPLTQTFTGNRVAWRGFPVVSYTAMPTPVQDVTGACGPTVYQVAASFQVTGLVTSITLETPVMATVTRSAGAYSSLQNPTVTVIPTRFVGFGIPAADLSITKSGPASVPVGSDIAWTLTVSNSNTSAASHGFVIKDAVPAGVTNARLVDPPPGCALAGSNLTCAVAPSGFNVTQNASVATVADISPTSTSASVPGVLAPGARFALTLAGTAPVSGASVMNTATVAGVDTDPNTANNTSTATTTLTSASKWTVAKTAAVGGVSPAGGVVKPGDVITYTVTAASQSGAVSNVVLADDLSDVLDDAAFVAGSAKLTNGGVTTAVADPSGVPAKLTTAPFTLASGATASLTYQVKVNATAYLATLTNSVTASGSSPVTSCAPCSTTHVTGALVLIQKNGYAGDGKIVGLPGSAFQLRADDSGEPGAVLTGVPVQATDAGSGRFQAGPLTPGTYWLQETVAPAGHSLLAAPVAFRIAADGSPAVADATASPAVTVVSGVLTVQDQPSLILPETGGTGAPALLATGTAMTVAAALGGLLLRRRQHPMTH